jgi:hypothetical protein
VERVLRALPKPPYSEARYWDQVYADTFRVQGAIEWGMPPLQMLQYQYVDEHGKGAHAPRVSARRAGRRQRILDTMCAIPLPLLLPLPTASPPPSPSPLPPPRQAPCAMARWPTTRRGMPTC